MVHMNNENDDPHRFVAVAEEKYSSETVPLAVINKSDGEILFRVLRKGSQVLLSVDMDVPFKSDKPPQAAFIKDPLTRQSYEFIIASKPYFLKLKEYFSFQPLNQLQQIFPYEIVGEPTEEGSSSSTQDDIVQEEQNKFLKSRCYSKGKYCSLGYLGKSKIQKPKEAIDQSIYEHCLWSQNPEKYFEFIEKYFNNCLDEDKDQITGIQECSKVQLNDVCDSFLLKTVESCYSDSFTNIKDKYESENSILAKEAIILDKRAIPRVPSFMINGYRIRVSINQCEGAPIVIVIGQSGG